MGKPNLVKDFCPKLPLDLDLDFVLGLGQAFKKYSDAQVDNGDWNYKTIGPGGLRAPCVLACAMRSLAIVITIVQSLSPLLLFSPSFAFDPLRGNSHVRNNFSPNILA